MPSRKFVYRSGQGVVEITPDGEKAQCDEISADVAERSEPMDWSGFSSRRAIPGIWPRVSTSLGCHPSQVREEQELLAKHGVQTDYTPDGDPIFRDQNHANRHMAVFDYCDADAGYSQRAPTKFTYDEWKRVSRRR